MNKLTNTQTNEKMTEKHTLIYPPDKQYTMNNTDARGIIPLILNVSTLRVLVFGTGTVARRKAQYFRGEVAEVRCLPKPDIPKNETTLSSLISSYDIIIAAADDPTLNQNITRIAAQQKKWYNTATDKGTLLIPAIFRDGDVTVAVSTNGKAPALAAYIRTTINAVIKSAYPALPQMVELQNDLRKRLKTLVPSQKKRAEILKAILEDKTVWERLKTAEVHAESILQRYA